MQIIIRASHHADSLASSSHLARVAEVVAGPCCQNSPRRNKRELGPKGI